MKRKYFILISFFLAILSGYISFKFSSPVNYLPFLFYFALIGMISYYNVRKKLIVVLDVTISFFLVWFVVWTLLLNL